MLADRIAIALLLAGILTVTSGCPSRAVSPTPAENVTNHSEPDSLLRSYEDLPAATSDKKVNAPDIPRQAGIGAALSVKDGKVFVSKVLPDTPAALSNSINTNDRIIAVAEGDEEPVDVTGAKNVASVVGMIRGPIGTTVRLTIVPDGKKEKDRIVVSLTRGDIKEIDTFVDGRLLPLGEKAPSFKFVRLENAEEADLSQLAGRIVVVEFWATWCGPCIRAIDELEAFQEQHPEWKGQVELLAVSVDQRREDAVTLVSRMQWSKVSIVWAGPDVLRQYRVAGLPIVFVIDRDGSVAAVDHRLDIPEVIKPMLQRSVEEAAGRQ